MLVSTTDSIEGRKIAGYLGLVSGDAVMGTNMFRDMFAGLRDIVGGRAGAYEKELKRAKQVAIEEMVEEARELGADAIVGVDLDYEHLVQRGNQKSHLIAGSRCTISLESSALCEQPYDLSVCSRALGGGNRSMLMVSANGTAVKLS